MDKKQLKGLSDNEVLELYMQAHRGVYFDILYSRYINKVYGKCLSLMKDSSLAEDATQEIFLKIFLNISKFNRMSKFSTWVYSITYNFCIDLMRKHKKIQSVVDDEQELPDVEYEVDDRELLEMEIDRLAKVLEKLQVDDKAVLLMKYQDDMSIKEISEVIDKSESAIKMKIKRAKMKAQLEYEKLYPNE